MMGIDTHRGQTRDLPLRHESSLDAAIASNAVAICAATAMIAWISL
jgi:hypothetical protein